MSGGYFRRYVTGPGYQRGIKDLLRAAAVFRVAGQPQVAARIERDVLVLEREVENLARKSAVVGTATMRRLLEQRLVRPETKGPHLSAHITSNPLPEGGVGYGLIEELEKAIDPEYADSGSYWGAIEFGTDAHVGRILFGYFNPGGSYPNPKDGAARTHAYFTPDIGGGFMRISRPIEAKHFLRDGSEAAGRAQDQAVQSLQAQAIGSMTAATARRR